MPMITKTGKQLGRVLGAAVVLCATTTFAVADCSKTTIDKHAAYAKVEVKNESDVTIFYDLYIHKGSEEYGDPTKSVTLQSGQGNKYETEPMHDNTNDYIKVSLSGEWQDGPGITKKGLLAECEYTVNNNKGTQTTWNWVKNTSDCVLYSLSEVCESCKITCKKQFTTPQANGNNHWSTTFTIE